MSQYCHSVCHRGVAMLKQNDVLGESLVGERNGKGYNGAPVTIVKRRFVIDRLASKESGRKTQSVDDEFQRREDVAPHR